MQYLNMHNKLKKLDSEKLMLATKINNRGMTGTFVYYRIYSKTNENVWYPL